MIRKSLLHAEGLQAYVREMQPRFFFHLQIHERGELECRNEDSSM